MAVVVLIPRKRRFFQHLPVVRVGHLNEGLGAFFQGLAKQAGDPKLRHDVVHQGTRGHHPCPGFQSRHDLTHALVRTGGHGQDGLSLWVQRGPPQEIHLATDTWEVWREIMYYILCMDEIYYHYVCVCV